MSKLSMVVLSFTPNGRLQIGSDTAEGIDREAQRWEDSIHIRLPEGGLRLFGHTAPMKYMQLGELTDVFLYYSDEHGTYLPVTLPEHFELPQYVVWVDVQPQLRSQVLEDKVPSDPEELEDERRVISKAYPEHLGQWRQVYPPSRLAKLADIACRISGCKKLIDKLSLRVATRFSRML